MRIFTGPIAVLCMLLLAGVGWTAAFHYSGNVGSRTAVQMELTRRGSSLTGSYWYDSIGNPLQLRGTLHIGRVTVWEFTESGRHTGTFTGRLSNGDRRFTGIWRSFDGRRSLPFSFTAVAEYRTRTVRGTRYVLTGTYPYFLSNSSGWQALNRLLSEEVRLTQRRFVRENTRDIPRWDIDFTQNYRIGVAYADNSLASLLITEDFYAGGAHPGLVYRSGNYLIERSRPRLLSQPDLFDPRTNYQLGLFNIVRDHAVYQLQRPAGAVCTVAFSE